MSQERYVAQWQLCPKCNGQGRISKPPYVPGDVDKWTSSSISFVCDVCNGAKILAVTVYYSSNEVKDPQEIWDDFSQHIDDDIDSLQTVAGSDVMTKRDFDNLCKKYQFKELGVNK